MHYNSASLYWHKPFPDTNNANDIINDNSNPNNDDKNLFVQYMQVRVYVCVCFGQKLFTVHQWVFWLCFPCFL